MSFLMDSSHWENINSDRLEDPSMGSTVVDHSRYPLPTITYGPLSSRVLLSLPPWSSLLHSLSLPPLEAHFVVKDSVTKVQHEFIETNQCLVVPSTGVSRCRMQNLATVIACQVARPHYFLGLKPRCAWRYETQTFSRGMWVASVLPMQPGEPAMLYSFSQSLNSSIVCGAHTYIYVPLQTSQIDERNFDGHPDWCMWRHTCRQTSILFPDSTMNLGEEVQSVKPFCSFYCVPFEHSSCRHESSICRTILHSCRMISCRESSHTMHSMGPSGTFSWTLSLLWIALLRIINVVPPPYTHFQGWVSIPPLAHNPCFLV